MSDVLSKRNRALLEPVMLTPRRTRWGDVAYFHWATINSLLDAAREEGRQGFLSDVSQAARSIEAFKVAPASHPTDASPKSQASDQPLNNKPLAVEVREKSQAEIDRLAEAAMIGFYNDGSVVPKWSDLNSLRKGNWRRAVRALLASAGEGVLPSSADAGEPS